MAVYSFSSHGTRQRDLTVQVKEPRQLKACRNFLKDIFNTIFKHIQDQEHLHFLCVWKISVRAYYCSLWISKQKMIEIHQFGVWKKFLVAHLLIIILKFIKLQDHLSSNLEGIYNNSILYYHQINIRKLLYNHFWKSTQIYFSITISGNKIYT